MRIRQHGMNVLDDPIEAGVCAEGGPSRKGNPMYAFTWCRSEARQKE